MDKELLIRLDEFVKTPGWKDFKRYVGIILSDIEYKIDNLTEEHKRLSGTAGLIMQKGVLKRVIDLPNEIKGEIEIQILNKKMERVNNDIIETNS